MKKTNVRQKMRDRLREGGKTGRERRGRRGGEVERENEENKRKAKNETD